MTKYHPSVAIEKMWLSTKQKSTLPSVPSILFRWSIQWYFHKLIHIWPCNQSNIARSIQRVQR